VRLMGNHRSSKTASPMISIFLSTASRLAGFDRPSLGLSRAPAYHLDPVPSTLYRLGRENRLLLLCSPSPDPEARPSPVLRPLALHGIASGMAAAGCGPNPLRVMRRTIKAVRIMACGTCQISDPCQMAPKNVAGSARRCQKVPCAGARRQSRRAAGGKVDAASGNFKS